MPYLHKKLFKRTLALICIFVGLIIILPLGGFSLQAICSLNYLCRTDKDELTNIYERKIATSSIEDVIYSIESHGTTCHNVPLWAAPGAEKSFVCSQQSFLTDETRIILEKRKDDGQWHVKVHHFPPTMP